MELDLGPELREFREEIRAWIAANAPQGLRELADWSATPVVAGATREARERAMEHPIHREWERRLLEARLICPHWPQEVGGRGWDALRLAVFNEECHRAGVPRVTRGMGEWLVGPSIIVHGTDEQRRSFLPRIVAGADVYCQGFSEPNHGSDLAGVECRGVVDGDEVFITGQKVWTSGAQRANMIFVLCRTDPDAPKHQGLSYVLVPFRDNRIVIRPLRQMSGPSEFCEAFFDESRAPLGNVIGGLGKGWRVAMTTLGFERQGQATTAHLGYEREFWQLVETARGAGRDRDPLIRQRLAWAYTQVQLMRFGGLRELAGLVQERPPGPEASITKLFWSEYHRRLGEIAIEVLGARALVRPEAPGAPDGREAGDYATDPWQEVFLASRAATIYSGTSQIQRNIIGERALGLPKEPRPEEAPRAPAAPLGQQRRQGGT
jgi:alkylation response protein AidB-like acyl-CoA dehydrogenase